MYELVKLFALSGRIYIDNIYQAPGEKMAKYAICAGEICFSANQDVSRHPMTPREIIALINETEIGRAIWAQLDNVSEARVNGGYKLEIVLRGKGKERRGTYFIERGLSDPYNALCFYVPSASGLVCALIEYSPSSDGQRWENARAYAPTRFVPKPSKETSLRAQSGEFIVPAITVVTAGLLEDILIGVVSSAIPALFPALPPLSSAVAFAGLSFLVVGTAYYLGGKFAQKFRRESDEKYYTILFSGKAKDVLKNVVGVGLGSNAPGSKMVTAGVLYNTGGNYESVGIRRDKDQRKMAVVSGAIKESGRKILAEFSCAARIPVLIACDKGVVLFADGTDRDVSDHDCFCCVVTESIRVPGFVPQVAPKVLAEMVNGILG